MTVVTLDAIGVMSPTFTLPVWATVNVIGVFVTAADPVVRAVTVTTALFVVIGNLNGVDVFVAAIPAAATVIVDVVESTVLADV